MHSLRILWAARNEEMWLRRQKRSIRRRTLEKIDEMSDISFIENFRLDKDTFRQLCRDLETQTSLRGTTEIPVELTVLCTLSFLATGSYQRIIGLSQHLPQRTASRCINKVVKALNNPKFIDRWIVFPGTQHQRDSINQAFLTKYQLPGVCGCIDCTHISIVKPPYPLYDEILFLNSKGYHSLNVQVICDDKLNILNVNSNYGGASDHSSIWSASQVEPILKDLHQNGEHVWLLSHSNYPQRAWLMTPILNAAVGSQEEIYTQRHVQARNCIECCFNLLKARWRCLSKGQTLYYHPNVASNIVTACCVLHNIALAANLPAPTDMCEADSEDVINAVPEPTSNQDELISGRAMRDTLINMM